MLLLWSRVLAIYNNLTLPRLYIFNEFRSDIKYLLAKYISLLILFLFQILVTLYRSIIKSKY